MKVALSVFKDSISTVFDVSQQLLVLEINGAGEQKRTMVKLETIDPIRRASQLSEEGINVLICGAISMPMQASVSARNILVYPFVRGKVEDVISAYRYGKLGQAVYALPGCRRRGYGGSRGRNRGAHHRWRG
ncbi:MAG: NifB/NifX family molybdenum-iron cluster-binding protein [Syntrophaceae bacterium]|nr:NifB/NifX family molybdenum-iron cluster-binding protein [Syntrophaceae bacterium]